MHYRFRSLNVFRSFSIFLSVCLCALSFILPRFVRVPRNPLNNSSRFHKSSLALVLFYFSYLPPLFSSSSFFYWHRSHKSLPPSLRCSLWVYLQFFTKLGLCLWVFITSRAWACGLVFENLLCLWACLRSCFIVHAGFIRRISCDRWELRRIYCTCIFNYII